MFCMCGKDPWIKKFFNTETEASSDLEDRGGEGGYRRWNSSKVCRHLRLLVFICVWSCIYATHIDLLIHACMYVVTGQHVQAEIYRVRSFWSCPGPGDRSLHIAPHAIPLASRLRPLATHRGAAQGATAEEVFSRTYSDLLQHLASGVECKSLNDLHEHDGIALWALNAMSFYFLNIQISCGSLHFLYVW